MSSTPSEAHGSAETLADLLVSGPLQLGSALRCANDIAGELRDLHQQTRAYGKLNAASIVLTDTGAHLLPQRNYWDHALPERDIQAFGAILYQMLTGSLPPATMSAADVRVPMSGPGAARLRASSMKLALKCTGPKNARLSMQQVATELRLLSVLQRQEDAHERPGPDVGPAARPDTRPPAAPFLVTPPQQSWPSLSPPTAESFLTSPRVAAPPTEASPEEGTELPQPPAIPLGLATFGQPTPKPQAKLQPAGGNCPKCDSTAVYVSRARSRFELLLERWKVPICRCHRCYHRYMVFARFKISKDMPVGTARKFRPRKRHN